MKGFLVVLLALALLPAALAQPKQITVLSVSQGNESVGGVADIYLEIRPGSGSVYIDSYPLTKLDTQISTRFAREYACRLAARDCSRLDFFYVIRASSTIIGGPSAGAAVTVLTYATLEDLPLAEDTVMTGTINSGGIIGPVGGIPAKVRAAADGGFRRVLVPAIEYNASATVDGVEVVAVTDVEEAIRYFTGVDVRPPSGAIVVPRAYTERMEEIADMLCTRARQLEAQVENASGEASAQLRSAAEASGRGSFYAAASYCFSAGLQLREQHLASLPQERLRQMFRQLQRDIDALDRSLPEDFATTADLEVFMIVRERLMDAYERLAREEYDNISSQGLAYALERYNSALVWSSFFGAISSQPLGVSEAQLRGGCQVKLAEAEERLNFIAYLLGTELEETRRQLLRAYDEQRIGEYALCIFTAAKARAEADSVISAVYTGENLNSSVQTKIDKAEEVLGRQTATGTFPILSYAYYEYARSLEDVYSANLYAEYALELAGLDIYVPRRERVSFYDEVRIGLLLSGILIGFVAGVLATELAHRRRKRPKRRRR